VSSLTNRVSSFFLIFVMLFNVASVAYAANSSSPSSAFSNLLGSVDVSTTSPGFYQSQARGVFTAGGVSIRFPRKSVQLISITPPSIQSGCGGISVFFGGFSFISGAEISQLITNIAQTALGYVLHLAIKTLCPQCAAVIEVMQKLAQMANKMGMDACAIGTKIGAEIGAAIFKDKPTDPAAAGQTNFCQNKTSEAGASDGFFQSLSSLCKKGSDLIDSYDKWLASSPGSSDEKKAEEAGRFGNATWIALDNMGYRNDTATKELLMSMIGTVITYTDKTKADAGKSTYVAPTFGTEAEAILDVFMCGTENGGNMGAGREIAAKYCAKRAEPDFLMMFKCDETQKCERPSLVSYQDWLTGKNWQFNGFMFEVVNGLMKAIEAVETAAPGGIPQKSLELLNIAPFPLYKVINIAAVYPSVATNLVEGNAEILAGLLAQQYFNDIVKTMGSRKDMVALPPSMAQEVRTLLMVMQERTETRVAKTNELMTLQLALMKQVNDINESIQTNLMPQGILGNQTFGANAGMYSKQ
jgi:hypothetical protein